MPDANKEATLNAVSRCTVEPGYEGYVGDQPMWSLYTESLYRGAVSWKIYFGMGPGSLQAGGLCTGLTIILCLLPTKTN